MRSETEMVGEVIAWRIRLRDGGAEEWEAFVRWLEQDEARSAAYDAVASADAHFDAASLPPVTAAAANDPAPVPDRDGLTRRRWFLPVGAVAAALILAFAGLWGTGGTSGRYEVATAAGEQKSVRLPGGGSVELNGSSRLVLDRRDARYAELAAGEATFTIRHDPAHPFELLTGGHKLRDLGTIFNVVSEDRRLRLEVGEGAVLFDPAGPAIPLSAGQTLRSEGGGGAVLGRNDPRHVGGWRKGQLSYQGASLAMVVGDLARTTGADIRLDPRLAAISFTGSIRVDKDDAATLNRMALVLSLSVRRAGRFWIFEPPPRAGE
jgi:transmembrane sensor